MEKLSKPRWWTIAGVQPVFSMFFLEAFVLGNWIPRVPDVKSLFDLTATQLGACLFVLASGTLVSFLAGGNLLKRLGLRNACMLSMPLWALTVFAIPFLPNAYVLATIMFAAGLSIGLLEIAMNTAADRLERQSGRRLMSKAHGFWSLGSLVGALVGGGIGGLGLSVSMHFVLVLPATALVGYLYARHISKANAAQKKAQATPSEATFKLPAAGLLLLCLMPIGIMVVEGAFIDWSALFIQDVLAGGALASGLVYAAFSTVMAATRLWGDWLLDRFGAQPVARISAVSATLGIGLFALSPNVAIAFIAALFAGLGTAIFYPLTMTEAANRPGDAEDNVSAMSLLAFTSFMLAPPLLGAIIDIWGMRVALLTIAPLAASSLLLTGELHKGGYHGADD